MNGGQIKLHSRNHSKEVLAVHGWFVYDVPCLRPFSVAYNPDVREHIKFEIMSLKTIKDYLQLLTYKVKKNIVSVFSDKIAIIFCGQSCRVLSPEIAGWMV